MYLQKHNCISCCIFVRKLRMRVHLEMYRYMHVSWNKSNWHVGSCFPQIEQYPSGSCFLLVPSAPQLILSCTCRYVLSSTWILAWSASRTSASMGSLECILQDSRYCIGQLGSCSLGDIWAWTFHLSPYVPLPGWFPWFHYFLSRCSRWATRWRWTTPPVARFQPVRILKLPKKGILWHIFDLN